MAESQRYVQKRFLGITISFLDCLKHECLAFSGFEDLFSALHPLNDLVHSLDALYTVL